MSEQGTQKPKMRLGLRLLLIGSLAINLVVVGIVGGAVIGHLKDDGKKRPHDRFGSPYVRALSFEDKRKVGRSIREAYRSAEIDRAAEGRSYARVVDLLRSSPLDQDALQNEVKRQEAHGHERRDVAQRIWIERVVNMTDTERLEYADRLEDTLKRGGRKDKEKRD
ncbi:periplasmic heavy metal sensor [Shimia abyssi]|uniref:Heavy-metal resistance protein n=1 Tax=Shimia abyssi TaxID=1662395 RepID=A0A2P8FD44_9RHOB|nr:periplasmic heavy metal sensor [Shimia abyssi]PSL19656.1 heavy-metal resistance protein [Shimia abyssi]